MNYIYCLLILVTLIVCCWADAGSNKKKNDTGCDRKVMQDCSRKLTMLGDETFIFPTNQKEMVRRCGQLKSLEHCVKDNARKCFNRDTGRSILVLLYSITKTNRQYCRTSKRRRAFAEFGQCANENIKLLNQYMTEMITDFHAIRSIEEKKYSIPLVCCNYFKFKTKILDLIDQECSENLPEIEALLNGYVGDLLNAGCGDYSDDSDMCDSIIPMTPNYTKPLEYRDFLIPLVQIIDQTNPTND